jgi:hypothetical protein
MSLHPPAVVKIAVATFVANLVALPVVVAITLKTLYPNGAGVGVPIALGLSVALPVLVLGFFAYKAYSGRNWARILLALWAAFSVYRALTHASSPLLHPAVDIVGYVLLAAQALGAVLLFVPSARAWFRQAGENRGSSA